MVVHPEVGAASPVLSGMKFNHIAFNRDIVVAKSRFPVARFLVLEGRSLPVHFDNRPTDLKELI